MPLLNPPDVLPEAMRLITRVLLARGEPLAEEELLRLVAPLGLVEALGGSEEADPESPREATKFKTGGRTIARASLAAMRTIDLVTQGARGERAIVPAPIVTENFPSWEAVTAPAFAGFLRNTSLASAPDVLGEDEDSGGAEDLAFAIALLFSVPGPLEPIGSFEHGTAKTLAAYQTDQFGKDVGTWVVRSHIRYTPLLRWVTYLGLGRLLNLGPTGPGLVVDPSAALRHLALPLIDAQTPVAEFLERLAPAMPYSDRGRIGSKLRSRLSTGYPDDYLSPGLALGLHVLHLRGLIRLTPLSDAESLGFPLALDRVVRYSHVGPGVSG
jgi:hypothetical protein